MRFWAILILLGALILLGIGSGAVAHTFSPPNESIAAAGPAGIDLIDARASGLRLIAKSEQAEATTWSPNRDVLAFALRNQSEVDVYSVRADGTSLRLVSRNASSPSWSPDGGQLVVLRESCAQEPCSSTEEFDTGNLFVVDADGGNTRQLTFGADGLEAPVWSPDGSWIAFLGADGIELVRPEDRKSHRRLGIAPVAATRLRPGVVVRWQADRLPPRHGLDPVGLLWLGAQRRRLGDERRRDESEAVGQGLLRAAGVALEQPWRDRRGSLIGR